MKKYIFALAATLLLLTGCASSVTEDSELKETLTNVPKGALTIALVDAETSVVIWAGIATAEIQQSPDQEVIKKRLEYAVSAMFKQLPK
jgi:hypothetical protein